MKLEEVLKNEFIKINSAAKNKKALISEIAEIAKKSPLLDSYKEEEIIKAIMEREELGSTGFGNGIAIPHCTLDKIEEFIVGLITIPDGVDFDSLDGKKVYLAAFIIAPTKKRNQHVRFLSNISSVLRKAENVNEILSAKTPEIARESFLRHLEFKEEVNGKKDYNIFTVVVQEEDEFDDILTIFTEIEDCSITVLEGNNAGYFLYSSPLFSNLWNERDKGFNRVIFALVKKSISNEVIRKMNMFVKDLGNRSGIMFVVQDLFYKNGSLDI